MSKREPIKQPPMHFTSFNHDRLRSQTKIRQKLQDSSYFCHYRNGMYMGGMSSFKKNGEGIILEDEGACAVVNHKYGVPLQHHVIFRNGSILSVEYFSSRSSSVCLRSHTYIILVLFNEQDAAHGKGQVIDFETKRISELLYKNGELREKREVTDQVKLVQTFEKKNLKYTIGQLHASAFNLTFSHRPDIKISREGQKVTVGFYGNRRFPEGLGFKMLMTEKHNPEFDLKIVERGYYSDQVLNGFGQRVLENGNQYIGYFFKGVPDRKGLIAQNQRQILVEGNIENGKFVDIRDNSGRKEKGCARYLRNFHNQSDNWIDQPVVLASEDPMIELLSQTFKADDDRHQVHQRELQAFQRSILMAKLNESVFSSRNRDQVHSSVEKAKTFLEQSRKKSKKKRSNSKSAEKKTSSTNKISNKQKDFKSEKEVESSKEKYQNVVIESPVHRIPGFNAPAIQQQYQRKQQELTIRDIPTQTMGFTWRTHSPSPKKELETRKTSPDKLDRSFRKRVQFRTDASPSVRKTKDSNPEMKKNDTSPLKFSPHKEVFPRQTKYKYLDQQQVRKPYLTHQRKPIRTHR